MNLTYKEIHDLIGDLYRRAHLTDDDRPSTRICGIDVRVRVVRVGHLKFKYVLEQKAHWAKKWSAIHKRHLINWLLQSNNRHWHEYMLKELERTGMTV